MSYDFDGCNEFDDLLGCDDLLDFDGYVDPADEADFEAWLDNLDPADEAELEAYADAANSGECWDCDDDADLEELLRRVGL